MTDGLHETIKHIIETEELPDRVTNKLLLGFMLELLREQQSLKKRVGILEQKLSKWKWMAAGIGVAVSTLWTIGLFVLNYLG
jgi:hypothetical protein